MKIVNSVQVAEIIGSVQADMLAMIGADHPKMTGRDLAVKRAQRHIVGLFAEMLCDAWPTVDGPVFGGSVVVQDK